MLVVGLETQTLQALLMSELKNEAFKTKQLGAEKWNPSPVYGVQFQLHPPQSSHPPLALPSLSQHSQAARSQSRSWAVEETLAPVSAAHETPVARKYTWHILYTVVERLKKKKKKRILFVSFSTHQVFGISWICVIHHTIFSIDVEFVPQGRATWGHSYWRLRGHATVRGQTLGTMTRGSAKGFNISGLYF